MQRLLPFAVLVAVIAMAAARAWTCDDAFITFRVVGQLLEGNGPVFNIGERVQVFTHPLWFMVLAAWSALGGSLFPGVMWLSLAIFGAGLALLACAFLDKPLGIMVAAAMLFFSRTLMDFATGGLETPLSFALFATAVFALKRGRNNAALASLALLPLNRLDLLPWVLPLAWIAAGRDWKSRAMAAAVVCVPAGLWALFSTLYYGAPLPNTAMAKLGGGITDRIDQGAAYLVASFITDPGALALLVVGIIAVVRMVRGGIPAQADRPLALAAAASTAIDIAYVLWSGGDFMLGRFVLPALWALLLLFLVSFPSAGTRVAAHAFATLALAHLVAGQSTTSLWLSVKAENPLRGLGYAGAVDERRFYLPWLGAYARDRFADPPGSAKGRSDKPKIVLMIGMAGYLEPRDQAIVDAWSLVDPLLARIAPLPHSRPGHGYRAAPREFWRWREPGYAFGNGELDEYARRLRLAHLSPDLWSAERWRAIAWLASRTTIHRNPLSVVEEGDRIHIDLDPEPLYRPAVPHEGYKIWLRVYDEELRRHDPGMTPIYYYTRAIDGRCAVQAVPIEKNELVAIDVPQGEHLRLLCPRSIGERDGILVRIGAVDSRASGYVIAYDEGIAIVRPALRWWLDFIPRWLSDGWRTRPWPPIGAAAFLLGVALLLGLAERYNFRFRRYPP